MTAQQGFKYLNADGTLNVHGLQLFNDLEARLADAEAKLTAIAAVTAPAGGATVDAEARAAIASIIAGAA